MTTTVRWAEQVETFFFPTTEEILRTVAVMNTWQKKMNRTEMSMKITVVIPTLITLMEMLAQPMALQDSQDLTGEVVDDVAPTEGAASQPGLSELQDW